MTQHEAFLLAAVLAVAALVLAVWAWRRQRAFDAEEEEWMADDDTQVLGVRPADPVVAAAEAVYVGSAFPGDSQVAAVPVPGGMASGDEWEPADDDRLARWAYGELLIGTAEWLVNASADEVEEWLAGTPLAETGWVRR